VNIWRRGISIGANPEMQPFDGLSVKGFSKIQAWLSNARLSVFFNRSAFVNKPEPPGKEGINRLDQDT